MKEIKGDLWRFHARGFAIVVPTNNDVNIRGECVMGRGVALQAKRKFPALAKQLGSCLVSNGGSRTRYFDLYRLFAFPVKFHWHEAADLALIDRSARSLVKLIDVSRIKVQLPVYLPRVGCGNGRLNWKAVRPVLRQYLDNRFTVVEFEMNDDETGSC